MSATATFGQRAGRCARGAWRVCRALLVLATLVDGTAEAGYVNTIQSGPSRSYRFDPLPSTCVNGQTSTGPLSCDVTDPFYGVESRATAYGDASGAHVTARTTFDRPLGTTTVINQATSMLSDVLTFTGSHPASAIVNVTANSLGGGNGNRFGGLEIRDVSGNDIEDECLFQRESTSCTISTTVSFNAGFELVLYASAIAWAGYFPNGELLDVSEDNFGYISAFGFTDLAGNPLTPAYVSQTGFTYPMSAVAAVVPEPTTIALLLLPAGMLALSRPGGRARRRSPA